MQNRIRSVKILEEVIGYFIHHEIDQMDIKFFADDEKMDITVTGTTDTPPRDLESLESLLNEPRKQEYEEYYWGLLGATGKRQELRLLGSLVDSGTAVYENGVLTVNVKRSY
ncbi:hypothetical protein ACHAL6_07160 [Proteiniclasticum sp. C24MP]|uniref:hypothetical protein n=1 Tax=Proteiniclasticum sp. C24MP TaxID=3374101 RepID=UPI00375488CD